MNEGTPEEVLGKIFRVFDVNGDGSITLREMTKLIKVRKMQSNSYKIDINIQDMYGMLKSDDPNLAAKEFIARTAFAEMDEDNDGRVSQAEFIKACLDRDEISKMLTLKIIDIFVEDGADPAETLDRN